MSKNTGTSELINYFDLGVNGDVGIAGSLDINTIANATTDTDTFLVSDTGIIKYRTGAQLLSDIGAQGLLTNPVTGTGTSGTIPVFTGSTTIGNSIIQSNATQVNVVGNGSQLLFDSLGQSKSGGIQYTNDFELLINNSRGTGSAIFLGNTNLDFHTNVSGNPRLRITDGGNILIGTTDNNGAKLQVNGGATITNSAGGFTASNYLQIEGSTANNSNYPGILFKGGTLATTYPEIELSNGGLGLALTQGSSATYPNTSQILLNIGTITLSTGSTLSPRLTVNELGNVGIGETSPAVKLHIVGTTQMRLDATSSGSIIQFWKDSSASFASSIGNSIPGGSVTNDLLFSTYNGSLWSERMRIASTGATTFSSSVTVGGDLVSNGGAGATRFIITSAGAGDGLGVLYNASSVAKIQLYANGVSYFNGGNVLIGTTTDSGFNLTVNGSLRNGGSSTYWYSGADGGGMYIETVGTNTVTRQLRIQGVNDAGTSYSAIKLQAGASVISFETVDIERMRITSAGDVCIGITSALQPATNRGSLSINGLSSSILSFGVGSATKAYLYTGGTTLTIESVGASADMVFAAGNADRLKITSSGNVLIGTTTDTGARLNVGGSYDGYPVSIEAGSGGNQLSLTRGGAVAQFYMGGSTAGGTQFYVRAGGSGGVLLSAGSTGWVSASDIRLKDVTKPIENAVESLSSLQTIYYSWKDSINKNLHIGLIAQEVEKVFPELVSESSIDGMKGVNYTELIPVIIKAIQELNEKINK